MGDRYTANGSQTTVGASPGKSALAVQANATRRGRVYYIVLSVGGTPIADNILDWQVRRFTAPGTSTAVTPAPKDPGAPAAGLSAGYNHSAEPTFSNTLIDVAVHQRSLYQWNAAPGAELIIPAVANNGIGITPIHASYTGSAQATMAWEE